MSPARPLRSFPIAGLLGVLVALAACAHPVDSAPSSSSAEPSADVSSAPSVQSARDATVAFWEARVAGGGGLESRLRLADALIERGRATGDLADLDRAAATLDDAAAPPADPAVLERRGRIAYALHDFGAAVSAAQAILALESTNAMALALLGDASLELGDVAAADAAYATLAEERSGPAVLSRLARRAWLGGDTPRAESLVREAIELSRLAASTDERAFYQYQLGELLRERNALEDAEAAYRASLDLQPDHAPSMAGLARVLEARGDRGAAIRLLDRASAILPAPDLVAELGDLLALAGRTDEAEDHWAVVERIADVSAASGSVHDRQLVLFLADHGRDPERAVALATAELDVRTDVHGHDALAWALHAAGRHTEAAVHSAEALRLGTADAQLSYHAGMIHLALGREADARAHLERARDGSSALPPLQVPRLEQALAELGS